MRRADYRLRTVVPRRPSQRQQGVRSKRTKPLRAATSARHIAMKFPNEAFRFSNHDLHKLPTEYFHYPVFRPREVANGENRLTIVRDLRVEA
jgi:hypothetical protein